MPRSARKQVVGGCDVAERMCLVRNLAEQRIGRRGDHPDHQVRMTREVLRAGLNRDVDAVLQGTEVDRRRPGVVHRDQCPACVRRLRDGGHVLHLERQRAGSLGVDEPGVRANFIRHTLSHPRVVEARFDPETAQEFGAEPSGRPVHRVGNEHVVAGADHGRDRHGHRGEPAAGHHGAIPALDRRDCLGQRSRVLGSGRSVRDVVVAVVAVEPMDIAVEVLGEDRRRPVHGKVDRSLGTHRRPTQRDELGVLFHAWSCSICGLPRARDAIRPLWLPPSAAVRKLSDSSVV